MGILSHDILRKPVTPASELGSTARSERASLMKRRRVDSCLRRNDIPHSETHIVSSGGLMGKDQLCQRERNPLPVFT